MKRLANRGDALIVGIGVGLLILLGLILLFVA